MLALEPKDAEQKQLVERILVSSLFRKSPRLSGFLRFVFDEQAAGRENAINEQLIGTEVFGRRSGYHVGEDSIVRSQARFLRQRLEQYFVTEGRNEPIILTIPKGSYIPAFIERKEWARQSPSIPQSLLIDAPDAEQPPWIGSSNEIQPQPLVPAAAKPLWLRNAIAITSGILLLLVGISFFFVHQRRSASHRGDLVIRAFWTSIFTPNRSVLFVPADSSLVTWERISGKAVPLRSYLSKAYTQSPPDGSGVWERLANSGYTSIADLNLVAQLDRIPEVANSRFQIRYGGDLSLSELKAGNAILSGGPLANPWVELFEPRMHLILDYDPNMPHSLVRDRQGAQKPDVLYVETDDGSSEGYRSYGVIGYLPSLDGQGHDLLLEGTSQAGTDAAAVFLQSNDFSSFLQKIGASESNIPNFEILISARSLAGRAYSPKIVTWYKLPAS